MEKNMPMSESEWQRPKELSAERDHFEVGRSFGLDEEEATNLVLQIETRQQDNQKIINKNKER